MFCHAIMQLANEIKSTESGQNSRCIHTKKSSSKTKLKYFRILSVQLRLFSGFVSCSDRTVFKNAVNFQQLVDVKVTKGFVKIRSSIPSLSPLKRR